jgi:hypothetical protein
MVNAAAILLREVKLVVDRCAKKAVERRQQCYV